MTATATTTTTGDRTTGDRERFWRLVLGSLVQGIGPMLHRPHRSEPQRREPAPVRRALPLHEALAIGLGCDRRHGGRGA